MINELHTLPLRGYKVLMYAHIYNLYEPHEGYNSYLHVYGFETLLYTLSLCQGGDKNNNMCDTDDQNAIYA